MNEAQLVNDETYDHSHLDNYSPYVYSTSASQSYFHDPSANGMTQSYSTHATNMVHHMVYQLQMYVKDNHELKQSIKLNNEEMENRFKELEEWKKSQKTEKLLLKTQFEKAYKATTHLKNENAFLKSENVKLEMRIQEFSKNNTVNNRNNEDEVTEDHADESSNLVHDKYLATVENLERRLKEAIKSCNEAQSSKEKMEGVYNQMLKINQALQNKLRDYELLKKNYRATEISYQTLAKELRSAKERCQNAEISNKEVKAQMVQVLNDVKAYQSEIEVSNVEKQKAFTEVKEHRNRFAQLQEQYKKISQECQAITIEKKQEAMNFEKKVSEKNQTLDELYHEYDKFRKDNDRLSSEVDNMYARVICAEESLQKKDREMKDLRDICVRSETKLKDEVRKLQEDVTFFKAQADVYKQDFLQEREDRAKTHEANEQLRARIEQLQNPGARFDPMRR